MAKEPALVKVPRRLPVWELKGETVFPYALASLSLPMAEARRLLDEAGKRGGLLALLPAPPAPRRAAWGMGVAAQVLKVSGGRGGDAEILVQGLVRIRLSPLKRRGAIRWADAEPRPDPPSPKGDLALAALRRSLDEQVGQFAGTSKGPSAEGLELLASVEEPGRYADLLAGFLDPPPDVARSLLDSESPHDRLALLHDHLGKEIEILSIQEGLEKQTRDEMDKRQREFYLRQQMEAIQSELGEGEGESSAAGYRRRLDALPLPQQVRTVLDREVAKLTRFSPFSEELNQARAYLDLALDLPWDKATVDRLDLRQARKDLDTGHYGLKRVKERILDHLAVTKLQGGGKGTLLCLVGPPGVGKTSLGKAIAATLQRKFVRMSLGGVRDEAEIRGHRRTYIGAMPGRIVQGIRNAASMNPVFLLDEVDKMGADWRGDPSSALLEALDGEQNREFMDHYLGFPFDLSRVMFIATANTLDGIHPALLDRVEVLDLPGYTEEEKVAIARRHILPRETVAHGLEGTVVKIGEEALRALIRRYTREAGLRNLERGIRHLLRRVARRVAEGETGPFAIATGELSRWMGQARFFRDERVRADRVGVAAGVAWTEMGGEMLYVEATATQGSGALTLTGQMGEVMRESVQAALTYLKEHQKEWKLNPKSFSRRDIHVHVPEGAIPKDGPSAGVTMAVAMLSTLTGRPVDHTAAFSGEITLRGEVLPVGGLREKLLAAQRARIRKVVLPAGNRAERGDLPKSVLQDMDLVWVKTMDEVFPHALVSR